MSQISTGESASERWTGGTADQSVAGATKNANSQKKRVAVPPGLRHSVRKALSGSTCVARRAGKKQASIAAAASRAPDMTNANGSLGLT
jgi:hypothetical protein